MSPWSIFISRRSAFSLAAYVALATTLMLSSGCTRSVSTEVLSRDLLDKFNAVAAAASNPESGVFGTRVDPMYAAMTSVLEYDRQNTHLFYGSVRDIAEQAERGLISDDERLESYIRVFASRGVVPNRNFEGTGQKLLLPIESEYALSSSSMRLLQGLYARPDLRFPVMQTVESGELKLGNNYVAAKDILILDPASIRTMAKRFGLDPDATVEALAVHETVHHIHDLLMPEGKYERYREHQAQINQNSAVRFFRWREVEEFMADAVMVQLGRAGVMFAATRMLEDYEAVQKPKRRHRKRLHDASARFIYLLVKAQEQRVLDGQTPLSIDWLRLNKRDDNIWLSQYWKRWARLVMTDAFVSDVRQAYLQEFSRIGSLLFSQEAGASSAAVSGLAPSVRPSITLK